METLPELNVLWTGLPHHYSNSTLGPETHAGSHPGFVVRFFMSCLVWAAFNIVFQVVHMQRLRGLLPPRPAAWEFLWQTYVLRRQPAVVLHNLVKRYGPVTHFRAWSQDLLVLSSVAVVEEFYKLHDMEFGARPFSMGRVTLSNRFNSLYFPPLATYWNHLHFILDMTTSEPEEAAGSTPGIEWALEALSHHPKVVDHLCEELERNFEGRDHKENEELVVQESDISKLPYLQAVVKELFRLHPPCAVSFPYEAIDDEYGHRLFGFEVRQRTQVLVNIYSLQRDPVMWGNNPDEFDPVRFVAHPELDMEGNHVQLLPFGGGRRRCPGSKLAILHVQLGLARHFSKHLLLVKKSLS